MAIFYLFLFEKSASRSIDYKAYLGTGGNPQQDVSFLLGDIPSASCGFGMTWLASNNETLVEEVLVMSVYLASCFGWRDHPR